MCKISVWCVWWADAFTWLSWINIKNEFSISFICGSHFLWRVQRCALSVGSQAQRVTRHRLFHLYLVLTVSFSSSRPRCCSALQSFLLFLFSVLFIFHSTRKNTPVFTRVHASHFLCGWIHSGRRLATRQLGCRPFHWHLEAEMSVIACRCRITQDFAPVSHYWLGASPAAAGNQFTA